jgi:hypothetical protein
MFHKFPWASHRCLPSVSLLNLFPHAQSFMIRFVCTSKVCRQRLSGNNLEPHSSPVSFLTHRQASSTLALNSAPWWNLTWSLTDRVSCRTRVLHPVQPHSMMATSPGSGRLSRCCLGPGGTVRREARRTGVGRGCFDRPRRGRGSVSVE